MYGKTITDKPKHKNIVYTADEAPASAAIRSNLFHSVIPLGEQRGKDELYETFSFKRTVKTILTIIAFRLIYYPHFQRH